MRKLVPAACCRLPGLGRARAGGDDQSCKPKGDEGTRGSLPALQDKRRVCSAECCCRTCLRQARCAACALPGPPIRRLRVLSAGGQAMTCGHMLAACLLFTCLSHAKRHARRGRSRPQRYNAHAAQRVSRASSVCCTLHARKLPASWARYTSLLQLTYLVSTSACPRLTSPSISPRDPRQRDRIERSIGTLRASSHLTCL